MKIAKNNYRKLKDIVILAAMDLLAIIAAAALAILIVNMRIDFTLSLLYWILMNILCASPPPPWGTMNRYDKGRLVSLGEKYLPPRSQGLHERPSSDQPNLGSIPWADIPKLN